MSRREWSKGKGERPIGQNFLILPSRRLLLGSLEAHGGANPLEYQRLTKASYFLLNGQADANAASPVEWFSGQKGT